jgi:hypothetical protein
MVCHKTPLKVQKVNKQHEIIMFALKDKGSKKNEGFLKSLIYTEFI